MFTSFTRKQFKKNMIIAPKLETMFKVRHDDADDAYMGLWIGPDY